jgi:Putative lumazine-binding
MSAAHNEDLKAVEKVVQTYLDGLYDADAEKLGSIFLPTSALTYVSPEGKLQILPRDEWLAATRKRKSGREAGLAREDHILSIDLIGPAMAYAKVKCQLPPRYFTDQLCLLKVEGRWQVAQKVFQAETR